MQLGTTNFANYSRVLQRIMWADFIDEQLKVAREKHFRASLVSDPLPVTKSLVACIEQIRNNQR